MMERYTIDVRGISVEVIRKHIRHIYVRVYPPAGRVCVAAPLQLDDEAVRLAVISRFDWICRHQERFRRQDRQSQYAMVTGENHYFQGYRFRLEVVEREGSSSVRLLSNTIMMLNVCSGSDRKMREAVLQRWYRCRLREQLPALLAKWEPVVGVSVAELRIRQMKTRWGTCNPGARRIWLNLELIRKPVSCLEYVLVHEMTHLHERYHNARFHRLMDEYMPRWRLYRNELNRTLRVRDDA